MFYSDTRVVRPRLGFIAWYRMSGVVRYIVTKHIHSEIYPVRFSTCARFPLELKLEPYTSYVTAHGNTAFSKRLYFPSFTQIYFDQSF